MSSTLTNIQLGTSVSTLDGLSVINADQLYVNGENVNPASPNIPIQPTTSNFVHPIVVTTSFGPQTASVLNVDGNTYLGYNPSLRILYTDKLTIGSQIIANGISAGTPLSTTYLALDASNRFITTSVPATSLVSITQIAGGYASPLYFCFLTNTASGPQVIYSDDLSPITYNTNNKYLTIKNLTATSGTWTNSGGTTSSQTLTCASFTASSSASLPPFCSFSVLPSVGTPAYFLAVDASNQVVVTSGISAQPTITATNTNSTFYITFAPNATTTSSSPLYVDAGASLTYNASSNTLNVPIADIPNLTANSSFTANGSNSIAGYAPLNSPGLTGIPTCPTGFAGVSSNQIASQEFVMDSIPNLNLYLTKTGTNAGVNTVFQFGPTITDSFEIKRNDGQSLMKLVQNSSQTMTVLNLLIQSTLQAYILQTTGYVQLGSTLQVTGNTTLSTATGVTPAPGNNSTSLATTAYVQSEIGNFITKTGTNTGINNILRLSGTSSEFVVQSSTSNPLLSVRQSASPYVSADSLYIITTLETAGNTTVGGNLSVTNALTATTGSMEVGSNVIIMRNVNYPHLFLGAGATAGNYFGQATTATNFVNDSTIGDLCINSRTGNIRLAGGAQYGRTNMLITNSGIGCQASSAFDFATAGNWDGSNNLFITTGGLGGNNSGVGMGFSTTLDSGLLCSIAPNVAWKRMTYKANDHRFFVLGNSLAVDINQYNVTVERQGLHLTSPANPYLYLGGNAPGNYIAHATTSGAFIQDSLPGDLCINSRTGDVRIASRQFNYTNFKVDDGGGYFYGGGNRLMYVNTTRVQVENREHVVVSESLGQQRMIWSTSGVGAMWRNDNANFYFLKTNYGDPYGVWDGTRPFYINLTSGKVTSANGMTSTGGFECDTFTAGITTGSHVALNGGNFFYMVGSGNQPTGCYLPQGFNLYKVYVSTTGNQFGTNDQWWGEAVVRYNNTSYNGSVTTTASNNVQVSCDANGQIYCYCPGGGGLFYAWVTWQRVI
jgi:hypothetical protein